MGFFDHSLLITICVAAVFGLFSGLAKGLSLKAFFYAFTQFPLWAVLLVYLAVAVGGYISDSFWVKLYRSYTYNHKNSVQPGRPVAPPPIYEESDNVDTPVSATPRLPYGWQEQV